MCNSQIWYVVSEEYSAGFIESIPEYNRHVLMGRSFLPLPVDQSLLDNGSVSRIIQHPGQTVVIEPGRHFHWVISSGPSISERCNFYFDIKGEKDRKIRTENFTKNFKRCLEDFETFLSSAPDDHRELLEDRLSELRKRFDKLAKKSG